jgi:NAD(P)-dependent dehydrogenase (short-subunit alcohol dehydrogenase family)
MTITSSSRVVLLGATSGIGLATAQAAAADPPDGEQTCSAAGAAVVVGSRNPASIDKALTTTP